MGIIVKNIKWIMLFAGLVTCTTFFAVINPQDALLTMFGSNLEEPLANLITRSWGFLIFLMGALLIFGAFTGILIIFFDPKLANNFLGLFFASLMALSFGLSQVYSRELRNLDISLLNAFVGWIGFLILLVISYFVEGNTILNISSINSNSWILILYQAIVVSLGAHLLMFYLYKFYTVGQIFPSYSLFPIFGIALSFGVIFPTKINRNSNTSKYHTFRR